MRSLAIVAVLAVLPGCCATQAEAIRNLGIGVTAEGAAVAVVAQVTRDPGDSRFDALLTAAPLLVPGAAMWIIGYVRTRQLGSASSPAAAPQPDAN